LVRPLLRSSLWPLVVALGVLAQPSHAQAPANAVPVKTYTGFFNNMAVYFTAFETNSSNFATVNGLVYAPRLSNANSAGVDNMIFFNNGAAGQTVVLQSEPGLPDYSPIHHVLTAAWTGGGAMPLITSYGAAIQWWQMGRLALQSTGIVFNGPVIVINRPLGMLGGGQLAPTISPNEFMGINPSARTAFFVGHQGYANGMVVTFLALEHAPGEIQMAPGASPVSTIDLNHLGHAAIANFFVAPGQLPLLDSLPNAQTVVNPAHPTTTPGSTIYGGGASVAGKPSQLPVAGATGQQPVAGATGQQPVAGATGQQPVAGATGQQPVAAEAGTSSQLPPFSLPPYQGLYSPIWHVHQVMFQTGVTQPLTSLQALASALSSGVAVQVDGAADATFNCPIVSAVQTSVQPVTATPSTPTTTPVYTPPVGGTTTPVGGTTGTGY
jgi:hypothetical protein